ncbi:MAG TPA: hypothetical protein VF598_06205, partial [Hymenobacter sp.]
MPTIAPDYLHATYRPDLSILVGRWMRSVETAELRSGYASLLTKAEEQACPFWLLDTRRRLTVEQADIHWMMEEFYPLVFSRLRQTVYFAFLLAPNQLTEVLANPSLPPLSYFDGRPYQVERFIDERLAA